MRFCCTMGGRTVVQDPQDAAFSEMPINAMKATQPDHVATLAALPALLEQLVREPAGNPLPITPKLTMELKIARGSRMPIREMDHLGERSVFTCPDCNGVMWEIDEGEIVRYRCHAGHAFTQELMSMALDESLYRALATALRALEERAELAVKLERDALARGRIHAARTWAERGSEFQRELEVVEAALHRMDEIAAMRSQGAAAGR